MSHAIDFSRAMHRMVPAILQISKSPAREVFFRHSWGVLHDDPRDRLISIGGFESGNLIEWGHVIWQ